MLPSCFGVQANAMRNRQKMTVEYTLVASLGTARCGMRCNGETLKERFDDFKADVDVHKAEHQEKDAIKDVERAAKHDAKSDVDLDKAAANVDKAIEREAEAKEG